MKVPISDWDRQCMGVIKTVIMVRGLERAGEENKQLTSRIQQHLWPFSPRCVHNGTVAVDHSGVISGLITAMPFHTIG